MKMSVTRALAELKTLDVRFSKSVDELNLVAVKQGNKLRSPNSSYKEEDFVKNAKGGLQSAMALYDRIITIKTAIDQSNSVTKIKIGNKEMTIQEALVLKKYINLRNSLVMKLQRIAQKARDSYEVAESENQNTIEKMISSQLGKDSTDAQKASARKEAEDYIEKTKCVSLVDPCGIDALIKNLGDDITEFTTNIDYALSESNSTTFIEIAD
jgi:hypothetical protein